jgi:uncharacterized protein YndB with AHSA1/START domain
MTHDSKRADAPEPIVVECDLDEAPEKVWRALTEPELLAAWLEPDAIRPADDEGRLQLDFGKEGHTVELETLTQEPHRLLRCRWRSLDREGGLADLDSMVTFELTESDAGGTHLRIVHGGFAATLSAPIAQRTFARRSAAGARRGTLYPRPLRRSNDITMRLAA